MVKELTLNTQARQVLDITNQIQSLVEPDKTAVNVYACHTTCSVTTADLDPGTDLDLLDAIEEMIPKLNYRHPHDPSHVWTHIASSIIGSSVTIPIKDNQLCLGTWQRIVLVELDGPRKRRVMLSSLS